MPKIQDLRAKRAEHVDALAALGDKMAADDYVENEADGQAFEDIKRDIADLDTQIARAEQVQALRASLAVPTTPQAVRLPAQPRATIGSLKAFRGADGPERAYRVGRWLMASLLNDEDSKAWCREHGVTVTRAQSEGSATQGQVLVPQEWMNSIITLREEYGVFRRNATVVPMPALTLNWPRRTGGLTANFIAEASPITETTATWDNVQLVAQKLAVLARWSTEIGEDAIVGMADLLTQEIAYAMAVKEDDVGFNGDGSAGAGLIKGITFLLLDGTHNAGKVAAATAHNTFATIDNSDITKLIGALPQYALAGAKFYCSSVAFALTFERLTATAGGNAVGTLDGAIQYRYLGFPVVITQKLPLTTGSQIGAVMMLFGNMALSSALGERRGLAISQSTERYFESDQIAIKGTERIDIKNHDVGDNTTAGPMVGLIGTT